VQSEDVEPVLLEQPVETHLFQDAQPIVENPAEQVEEIP